MEKWYSVKLSTGDDFFIFVDSNQIEANIDLRVKHIVMLMPQQDKMSFVSLNSASPFVSNCSDYFLKLGHIVFIGEINKDSKICEILNNVSNPSKIVTPKRDIVTP